MSARSTNYIMTDHAIFRLIQRHIPPSAIPAVLQYGERKKLAKGKKSYKITGKIACRAEERGINLWTYNDIIVITTKARKPGSSLILTVAKVTYNPLAPSHNKAIHEWN